MTQPREKDPLATTAAYPAQRERDSLAQTGSLTVAEKQLTSVVVASGAPAMLERALSRVKTASAPFGARVELLPDGVLVAAILGRGNAREQARQAARCALAVRDVLEEVPVALATGRTVPGAAGIVGEVVERAIALLRAVVPTTSRRARPIALDEATAGLLDAQFDVVRNDDTRLLRRERSNAAAEGSRTLLGRPTRFVGRERELAALEAIARECCDDGVAHAVLITGPAGVGKTRLRLEFLRRLAERGESVEVWTARGNPISAGSALDMIAQLLRSAIGVGEGETLAARQAKLAARVAKRLPAETAGRATDFLGELGGIRFPEAGNRELQAARRNPVLMGDQMRRAWDEFLAAECSTQPVVVVLEDLHWGDVPTVSYVDGALRTLRNKPIVVLAVAQPEVHRVFPQLWAGHPLTELRLGELSRRASEALVREVVGQEVDDATVARVVEHASGNAFYLEELIRFVAEGRDELPATIVAMAQARIASLEPETRRVLRAASVFGAAFWTPAVASLVGTSEASVAVQLDELSKRELVTRREHGKYASEYAFRHGIVREAAYGLLTDEDRLLGHQLAGDWLEAQGEADGTTVAEHFERGGMPARATAWYERAAILALEGNDFDRVVAMVAKGVASGANGEQLGRLHLFEAQAHRWRGRFAAAEKSLRAAVDLLPRGTDAWHDAVGGALSMGAHIGHHAHFDALVAELTDPVAGGEPSAARVGACTRALVPLMYEGFADHTVRLLEYVERASAVTDPAVSARVHQGRASRGLMQGDPSAFLAESAMAAQLFDLTGDLRNACKQLSHVAFGQVMLGAYGEAESTLRGVLASAERMSLTAIVIETREVLGITLAYRGSLHEARAVEERALEEAKASGQTFEMVGGHVYLAEILALAENYDAAERVMRRGLAMAGDRFAQLRAYAMATYAGILASMKRYADALQAAQDATTLLGGRVTRGETDSRVRVARAIALHETGDTKGALEVVLEARDLVMARASRIPDERVRRAFLRDVRTNALTLRLAEQWTTATT